MEAILQHTNGLETKANIRGGILAFEDMLKQQDDVVLGDSELCPLTHKFCDGMYVREIFIPAGIVLTGKLHKHSHPNFLMQGEVEVYTEYGGLERLKAPMSMISKAGTKRVVKTITDCIWVTVHSNLTNTQDLTELEKIVIADSYEDYEKFVLRKSNFVYRMIDKLKDLVHIK